MASVNRPTDVRQKEKDINNKLQLYGIYSAFTNGKVPSNKQIDIAMNSALSSRAFAKPSTKLSSEGQHLVHDLRDVIEKAKILLLTKNEGNLLQDFIWQCQNIDGGNAGKPALPIGTDTAKQHGSQALDGLRTLGTLIISNGQFRKLLNDSLVLFRDIAGDAAQKAANKVRPDQEQLDHLDEPADDNTWQDTPDVSGSVGKFRDQAKSTFNKAKSAGQDAKNDAQSNAQQQGGNNADSAVGGAKAGLSNLKDKMAGSVDDDTKEKTKQKVSETRDRTKDYLNEKMPQERRDQTIWRLKKMIVEIQGHQDYQQAIDTLLGLAEEYKGHTKNLTHQTSGAVKGAHTDSSLQNAEADMKILIERFANNTSTDDLLDAVNAIYHDADQDPELKGWFRHMNRYVRKCLKEQGYVLQDSATNEWNKLYDQGNFLLRDRYRNHTDRIADEVKFLADQFDSDPQNKAFANALTKLFNELGNDEDGKPTFKPHLIKDLSQVIVPSIFENVRYIPIPRVEYSDPMMDAIVENLVIEGDNLTPNVFEFGSDNYWRWGRKSIANKNKNKVLVSVSGVQMDLKDVSYYVHKKTGFPSVRDKGVMDIFLGGTGFSFKIAMETADKTDRAHFFKVNRVDVDVKNMNIRLKQSSHKLLFNIFKPLLLKVLLPVIQKVLEKVIKDNVNKADAYAYSIQKEVDRAANEAKKNPDQAGNIYQRYANAAQEKYTSGKKKTQAATQDKQVNVAVTQYDSMFKNISLPGGISSKATEYRELAAKGDRWESPVFSLGSARESTNLPKVAAVSRKPHRTAPSQLKAPQNTGHSTTGNYGNSQSSDNYGNSQSAGNYGNTQSTGNYGNAQPTGNYANTQPVGNYGNAQSTGNYGSTQSYANYGSSQPASSYSQGYGNAQSTGTYPAGVGGYDGQPNGTSGFSTQVNKAFSGEPTGGEYALSNSAGYAEQATTSLGLSNPVLQGRV